MTQLSTILPSLTRQKTKCLPCRDALYHPHQLRHAIHRHTLHQKMHMISIRANLQKFHLVALFNLYARLLQHLVNFAIYYRSPILRRKYQVIHQHRDIVALVDILAHPSSLTNAASGGELDPKR